jgi:hypothetical protein
LALEELRLIEKQISQLDQEFADLLRPYQDQVQRLGIILGRWQSGFFLRRSGDLLKPALFHHALNH